MKTFFVLLFLLMGISQLHAQDDLDSVPPEVLLEKAESLMQEGNIELAQKYLHIIQQNYADSEYAAKAEELTSQSGQYEQKLRTSERPSTERHTQTRQQPRQRPQQYKTPEYCLIIGTQKAGSNQMVVRIEYGQPKKWMDNNAKMILDQETHKPKQYRTMIEALNYQLQFGWEYMNTELYSVGESTVQQWMLSR